MTALLKYMSREQAATSIAVFFHSVGLAGLLFYPSSFFTNATPFNLLLSFGLLIWTQPSKNWAFGFFLLAVVAIGFFVEVIGVNTGLLFGDYAYGKVLGVQWLQVPLIIGINWFIIIYCCGMCTHTLLMKVINKVASDTGEPPLLLKAISVIVDGATLAVLFDWLIEPVAVKLGFWAWKGDGSIPFYNYICWFLVSLLLLAVFQYSRFDKQNKFAINLLLIQALFFLLLRTFL